MKLTYRHGVWLALAWALFAVVASGDEVDLELKGPGVKVVQVDKVVIVKEDATVVTSFPFSVSAPSGGVAYFWRYPDSVSAIEKGNQLEIKHAPKGQLTITVQFFVVDFDAKKVTNKFGNSTVSVGDVPTPPIPPDPPGPKPVPPDPKPPEPKPAPINADGLHVLIVYETADKAKLPKGQFDIIYGLRMREWLKAYCTIDQQSFDKRAFWIVDQHENLSALDKKWQNAAARPRQSVPWLIVSNAKIGGYEGPLPDDVDAAIKLMEKYK